MVMIIKNQDELIHFCKELAREPFVTIDTEFLREKTYYPKLCLIQMSGPDGKAKAIDPLEGDLNLTPIFDLLQNKDVLKVFHAGRQDLEIFYNLTGKVVEPFFDTQIAAMVCGYGDSAGYESLVRKILDQKLDKSSQFTDWSRRPLSQKQIDYALGDVTYLIDIYKHLSKKLDKMGRTKWVMEEEKILANPETYENRPEEAYERIKIRSPKPKTLAILRDLAAWREEKAQEKNIPRNWVMRDETLVDMASQAPKTTQELARIRNMPKELPEGHTGAHLLSVIKKAQKTDKKSWPTPEKKKVIDPTATALIDVLKLLLKVQSAGSGVAAKLIADKTDIETLATSGRDDVKCLKGWRYDVFGQYALALKRGELSIGVRDNEIALFGCKDHHEIYEE